MTPATLSQQQVGDMLANLGLPLGDNSLPDAEYCYDTKEWVVNSFLPWWQNFLLQMNFTYILNQRDCHEFSSLFVAMMRLSYWKDNLALQAALLVGRLNVNNVNAFAGAPANADRHSVNLVLAGPLDDPSAGWLVIEPQNAQWCQLKDYPNKANVLPGFPDFQ